MEKKKLIGDVPVGETFEFNGETYKVRKPRRNSVHCTGCEFDTPWPCNLCNNFACERDQRKDKKDVYFVKVK